MHKFFLWFLLLVRFVSLDATAQQDLAMLNVELDVLQSQLDTTQLVDRCQAIVGTFLGTLNGVARGLIAGGYMKFGHLGKKYTISRAEIDKFFDFFDEGIEMLKERGCDDIYTVARSNPKKFQLDALVANLYTLREKFQRFRPRFNQIIEGLTGRKPLS